MSRISNLRHEFVESFPDKLEDGKLYVSIKFSTAAHRCCCGCGNEIITPIRPDRWTLIFNGKTVTLRPSIGNWSISCQSHYWITENGVRWDEQWSQREIEDCRRREPKPQEQSGHENERFDTPPPKQKQKKVGTKTKGSAIAKLKQLLRIK